MKFSRLAIAMLAAFSVAGASARCCWKKKSSCSPCKTSCRKSCTQVKETCDPKPMCCRYVKVHEEAIPVKHVHTSYICPPTCAEEAASGMSVTDDYTEGDVME